MTGAIFYETNPPEPLPRRESVQPKHLTHEEDQRRTARFARRLPTLMGCFHPLPATQLRGGGIIIHKRYAFDRKPTDAAFGRDLNLPCGRCIGCRLDRSKQWAIRLMHEAQLHERNSFITLTYSEATLAQRRPWWEPTVPYAPPSGVASPSGLTRNQLTKSETSSHADSLRPRDLQLLMKRLRKDLSTRGPEVSKVRFYAVGEYGEKFQRPHYHIALFGEDFSGDRYYWRTSDSGHRVYRSPRLESIWQLGNCEVGELTIDSAAYVAAYVMKKINGKQADEHYKRLGADGEYYWIEPEFAHMSRGGRRGRGLASEWFSKFHSDVYPHDHVIHNAMKMKPPRYYDKLHDILNPANMAVVRMQRELRAQELAADNTPARLADKEAVTKAKMALKQRQLEKDP